MLNYRLSQCLHQENISSANVLIHFVVTVARKILRSGRVAARMSNGFPEVGAVHQVATQEFLEAESPIPQNRPPIFAVEYFFLRNIPFSALLLKCVKRRFRLSRKWSGSGLETGGNSPYLQTRQIQSRH